MKDTAPFIAKGFYTVPLIGTRLTRDEKGKKQGFNMPSKWQETYSKQPNTTATPIGAFIPINYIAIDCDSEKTYNLFRGIDPSYTAYTPSIGKLNINGKTIKCGTIIYKHSAKAPRSFRAEDLDFFNQTGMIFLPTEPNETKGTWVEQDGELYNHKGELIEFKEAPQNILILLDMMANAIPKDTAPLKDKGSSGNGFLARVIEEMDFTSTEYYPSLTKVLTPKGYRNALYRKQGHLHPNDIDGSGHMYLFKVSCILSADNTINKVSHLLILTYLNNLWDRPMDSKSLLATYKNMEDYWEYDPDWESKVGFSLLTKRDRNILEVFYDGQKLQHYVFTPSEQKARPFSRQSDLIQHLNGVVGVVDTKSMHQATAEVHTYSDPTKAFGYFNSNRDFNLFSQSEALAVLKDPTILKHPKRPIEFINFMEHFIPSEEQRDFFLRLLRTKLSTFSYSPIVPYIIGIQGSGKNTLMTIIQNIMGDKKYVKTDIGGEQFLEKYNSWLMDTYFVQLNELGDTVNTRADKKKAQGILKNYTGSKDFECRAMHRDTFTYPQTAMFIMTANYSPLNIEDTDRRLYYISTPNTFDHSHQCMVSDPSTIYDKLMGQTLDIAHYLSTEYTNLEAKDYIRAPQSEGKNEMVFNSLPISVRIAWALAKEEYDLLAEFLINPLDIFKREDTISLSDLTRAYSHHTSSADAESTMKSAMKQQNIKAHFSPQGIYYIIDGLGDYDSVDTPIDTTAEEIRL